MGYLIRKVKLKLSSDNKKIAFLFFASLFSKGGHTNNFINLIKHIEPEIRKNKCTPFIISFNNTSGEIDESKAKISKSDFLKFYKIKIYKRIFPSGKTIYQLIEYIFNFIRTAKFIIIHRPDIVYAYAEKPLYLTFPLKKIFRFRLIYDMRGDILDELKARGASDRYISGLSRIHSKALNYTDLAFSVNNVHNGLKFIPKYNYYDGNIFRYNEKQMLNTKKELKLEDKFIFVYTGNTHYYQYLDGTVRFYSQFYQKHKDSYFIIITEHDTSKIIDLLNRYNIPDTCYLVKTLPQNKIPELQQIADMGFLMREDLPLNHNSFPTKFAEYLSTGVPVLMTPYIYSIVPMVKENGLGEVIEIKDDHSEDIDKIYIKYKNNLMLKKHCSDFAMKELMWQNKGKDIFEKIIDVKSDASTSLSNRK